MNKTDSAYTLTCFVTWREEYRLVVFGKGVNTKWILDIWEGKSGLVTPCLDCGQLMDCFTHGSNCLNFIKWGIFFEKLGVIIAQEIFLSMHLISYIIRFCLLFGWLFGYFVIYLVSKLVC